MKYLLSFLVLYSVFVSAEDRTRSQVESLKNHILNSDYPEVFDDKVYRVGIENVVFDDIDSNGKLEAIVHYKPHYRQSPTIVLYQFNTSGKIDRFMEALAPGALVKLGDYYLDSHSLGQGVDFTVQNEGEKGVLRKVIETAIKKPSFGNFVLYPDFIHADGRKSNGIPTFIDLSYLKPLESLKNCESFEFHELNQIATGDISGQKYLSAWVGEEIYFYKINEFMNSGFLDKEQWIIKTPKELKHLNQGSPLSYTSTKGEVVLFESLPHKALQRTSR
jgi:hypothetical protein